VVDISTVIHETLQRIVDFAVGTTPGCDHAGVSVVHAGRVSTPAASDAVALRVAAIQSGVREGPCLDAIASDAVLETADLIAESRWPRFSTRVHEETGVSSILAFRLSGRTLGSLNLFSKRRFAFGSEAHDVGLLFAVHAAVALQAAQTTESLPAALETRDIIGQAKGILMERQKITDDEAFQVLVRASQRLNVKLSVVARRLAETKLARTKTGTRGEGP
jgi:hypothetical protein